MQGKQFFLPCVVCQVGDSICGTSGMAWGFRFEMPETLHTGPAPTPSPKQQCQDAPGWKSRDHQTCADYSSKHYCTKDGGCVGTSLFVRVNSLHVHVPLFVARLKLEQTSLSPHSFAHAFH